MARCEGELFQTGDAVFVKNFGKGEEWVKGEIVEVLGLRNLKVLIKDFGNIIWKRHVDQIMHTYLVTPDTDGSLGPSAGNLVPAGIDLPEGNYQELFQQEDKGISNGPEVRSEIATGEQLPITGPPEIVTSSISKPVL